MVTTLITLGVLAFIVGWGASRCATKTKSKEKELNRENTSKSEPKTNDVGCFVWNSKTQKYESL